MQYARKWGITVDTKASYAASCVRYVYCICSTPYFTASRFVHRTLNIRSKRQPVCQWNIHLPKWLSRAQEILVIYEIHLWSSWMLNRVHTPGGMTLIFNYRLTQLKSTVWHPVQWTNSWMSVSLSESRHATPRKCLAS